MVKVVALTGAGISKARGIPTFEELEDLRLKLSRKSTYIYISTRVY